MTFQLTNPDSTNQAIFGTAGQFSFRWYGANNYFRTNGSNNVNFSTSIDKNAQHTVVKTATKTTIDGTYTANTTEGTVTLSLYLFAQHGTSAMQNPAKVKIPECKIYESDVLVRYYKACLDPNGVVCMYEEANKQYVYNAGTGAFLYGGGSGGSGDDNLITVSIRNTASSGEIITISCPPGMTWGDFVDSEYNTLGFYIDSTRWNIVTITTGIQLYDGDIGESVYKGDTISPTKDYMTIDNT